MKDEKLETLLNELEGWSKSVGRQAIAMIPQVRDAIEKDTSLPEGCPSRASMAALILSQIEKPVSEVTGIMQMIREHLFEHYGEG
jgi:uncharacterized protein (DUF2342 family)